MGQHAPLHGSTAKAAAAAINMLLANSSLQEMQQTRT
jgi:hypothetical protein